MRQRGKMLQSGAGQMTVWRMLIACWIAKAINTQSEYVCHHNNGCTNAPQYYVIRTLAAFLLLVYM